MNVNGVTELVGIIGYPIDYTMSPAIHNAAFRALEMNWLYVPLRVPPGQAGEAVKGLRALGFRGANVTIPHKVEVARCVDELKGDAALLQAVNTVVVRDGALIGHNTDTEGFAGLLHQAGIALKGSTVLIIGAGGACRAVGLVAAREGAGRIYIMNRTSRKAGELVELLKGANPASEIFERTFDFEGASVAADCDVIINGTPLAERDERQLPLDYECLTSRQWVLDLKYGESGSAFLEAAAGRGARTADGAGMLLAQAAASFRIWTGRNPPRAVMREALNRALSRQA
jgi:shikimate dehydrogenase